MSLSRIIVIMLALFLLSAGFARGDDHPTYQDGVLTIPSVNTDEQVGQYQDAVLQLNAGGLWQLKTVKALRGNPAFYLAPVNQVEVVKTEGMPAQVFLRVSGSFTSGCGSLGRISQRLVGNQFDISLADGFTSYGVVICTANMVPFIKTIPLSIYGLSAGIYSYNVNGMTGTFYLATDNALSGDCFGSAACQTSPRMQ